MPASYLIDGKPAQREDFVRAIDELPSDDLDFVSVKIPDRGEVSVLRTSEGFLVHDERLDGSTWMTPALPPDRAKDLVRAFVEDRPYWRDGVEWEMNSLTTRDAWVRFFRIALIGFVLIAVVSWLTKLLAN